MILGTAGHIDHGKTTLVRALTGVDADRLPEEKRRGITIELGFAPLVIEGVGTIGIVDVPGHEAFVRTMLAGATGIDIALLVIAADEGVMPQTREHATILELLGVGAGVVALTKCDLAEPEWMDLVAEELGSVLARGPLANAPIVRCSATTGEGIADLKAAIAEAARRVPGRRAGDLLRMPVDRAFSVKGTGTVVTGTLWSGEVRAEDLVAVLPDGPSARVRGVEAHGHHVAAAASGERAAVALVGVDRADVRPRGSTLVRQGDPWRASSTVRADVLLLEGAGPLGPRTRIRFHLGTADVAARIVAVGGPVRPGTATPVRVALDEPVVARGGDRFVLRAASPAATIGGGIITDPTPRHRRPRPWPAAGADAPTRLAWIVGESEGDGLAMRDLLVRVGIASGDEAALIATTPGIERVGDRLFLTSVRSAAVTTATQLVNEYHVSHPLEPGLPTAALRSALAVSDALADDVLRGLVGTGAFRLTGGVVARADWKPGAGAQDSARISAVLAVLVESGTQPPSVGELAAQFGRDLPAILKVLAADGRVVAVSEDRYFAAAAARTLTDRITASLSGGASLTASQLRDITGLTRKHLIPFLEYCDRTGVTVRRGDERRLPG